jgi:hypothetical protein
MADDAFVANVLTSAAAMHQALSAAFVVSVVVSLHTIVFLACRVVVWGDAAVVASTAEVVLYTALFCLVQAGVAALQFYVFQRTHVWGLPGRAFQLLRAHCSVVLLLVVCCTVPVIAPHCGT